MTKLANREALLHEIGAKVIAATSRARKHVDGIDSSIAPIERVMLSARGLAPHEHAEGRAAYAANVRPLVMRAVQEARDALSQYIAAGAFDSPDIHHMRATCCAATINVIARDAERILSEFSGPAK